MRLKLIAATLLAAASSWAQAPAGRWDGTITIDKLKVPLRLDFSGAGPAITGSFVNGDTRVESSSGSFENGVLRLTFARLGAELRATLADGELKGEYGDARRGKHPISARAYCTCGFEGEAGPPINGTWKVAGQPWTLTAARKGDDTLVTVDRDGASIGPVSGRFDGLSFLLQYFDGERAAVLELEPRKDGALDVIWSEPGKPPVRTHATRQ